MGKRERTIVCAIALVVCLHAVPAAATDMTSKLFPIPEGTIDGPPPVIPDSIKRFYPPSSKIYVFKETMLRMGLLFTAVSLGAKENNWDEAATSIVELEEKYLTVPEMVPEWKEFVVPPLAQNVRKVVATKNSAMTLKKIDELRTNSCDKCHQRYMKAVKDEFMDPALKALMQKLKQAAPLMPASNQK